MDETKLMERKSDPDYRLWEHHWFTKDDGTVEEYKAKAVAQFMARTGYEPERVERWQQRADILFLGPVKQ